MLAPISITLSCLALNTKGNKTFVSTTYIAYFGEGREKMLNRKDWLPTNLLRTGEYGVNEPVNTVLSNTDCCLYYRDWSNVPVLGLWDKHYPSTPIIPTEITSLMGKSFLNQ